MWSSLPFDLLANIFSFLSPDSLARARSACRHWHTCVDAYPLSLAPSMLHHHPPWFVALPTRNREPCCYVHNPVTKRWHMLSLEFLSDPFRPITCISGLILLKATKSTILSLAMCNPFTRQFRHLPLLNIARTNPAVGVVILNSSQHFRVYVAGGMSEASRGGATYEPTLEMYDSRHNTWKIAGSMPVEFAVRLTVWSPNESVYSNGILYWITSARAFSMMAFEIESNKWQEVSVPMADRLEFATLVQRSGRLTLVGSTGGGEAFVWKLNKGDIWCLIEKVPVELGVKLLRGKASWGSIKCVGGEGAICLYRDLGSGMLVWREVREKGKWEWLWVEGCCSINGKQVENISVRGLLIHPNLASSCAFSI
ncbi:protein UNUSUAL FLORAL ORGANS [Ricinus communis]|uniref:Ubiquitin-protein ligase, putative n=1 Tax=Ricinus communis TaxID=3988 RepID=B9RV30_RICCO|nr:protein UNUSUAL FLORAL ORGANS [Ricinus communis]EEF44763.1 ubiquitin-protein ligase, putative [Ricinus communis]|eukprot:XP_002517599.1 protein UNUSUAL FLORAL ORGANS [Ricinus communis]